MNDIRFGIIGATAVIANSHIKGITENDCKITAFMDVPAKAEEMKAAADEHSAECFTDYAKMLAEAPIDAVALCTPHPLHCEQAIAALEAGKHVMTEKPMAVRISECDRMIEADKNSKSVLGVIFQRRFNPAIVKAKEMTGMMLATEHNINYYMRFMKKLRDSI